jgi:hypothetical protein
MKPPAAVFVLGALEKRDAEALDKRRFRCRFHGIREKGVNQRHIRRARISERQFTGPAGGNCSGLSRGESSSPCWMPS